MKEPSKQNAQEPRIQSPRGRALGLILWITFGIATSSKADLTLADKGQSRYRIVVAANAIPSERYAAEELQRYLERIGKVKLPIVTDAEKTGSRDIILGDNAHLKKLNLKIDFPKLGHDG
ncbi:MAG: hypothetical protein HY674_01785, partial [Chloroflexi bacterium]|nr:hypothetical protein [Chloroflexota bacterium]